MWPMTKSDAQVSKRKHAIAVLVRGLPGSGKSFITDKFVQTLQPGEVIVLDPDKVDTNSQGYTEHIKAMQEQGVDERLHVYRYLRGLAYDGIAAGSIVIWNQPFTNLDIFNKMVANFRLQAEQHDVALDVLVVEIEIDPILAKTRVETRKEAGGHGPSEQTFQRFSDDYVSFAPENYDVISVRGDDAQAAVTAMQTAIGQLR